jgi:nucleotide-binding universal stress UspA family protein
MGTHVLVGYDGTDRADAALDHALDEYPDASFTVLTVIDPTDVSFSRGPVLPDRPEEWFEDEKAAAEETLEAARERAADRGVDVETDHVVGRPASAICEYADEHDVDHVVVGSHGRTGVARVLLGSVAEAVMRRSPSPVTVVR